MNCRTIGLKKARRVCGFLFSGIMKKIIKYTGLSLLIFLSGIFVYYGYSIKEARNYTHEIIFSDLAEGQWRRPGDGAVYKFEIFGKDLSKRQKKILIKVQDPGFYKHNGMDLSTPGAGLTTITQAITKKLYFDSFKPGISKIKQSLIARFVVNELISKDDQLSLFVNAMHFGSVDGKIAQLETNLFVDLCVLIFFGFM